jgi:predicted O-methyltransferase YrrM
MSIERPTKNRWNLGHSGSRAASSFRSFFRAECATAAQVNFHDYAGYAANYEELAIVLGHSGRKAQEDDLHLIRGLMTRRTPREGSLNLADTLFLAAMVSILSPERVIEVGTGTGFSSAVMAAMLRRRAGGPCTVCVETIDVKSHYRGDESVHTGGDIATLIPEFASSVRVHSPRKSDFVDQLAKPNELQFGFIDANHRHPCPLLDLLRLARVTRPGGWIALHDVALGSLVAAAECAGKPLPFGGQFGAEWLFQMWPFEKVKSGNSGAIQLPRKKREIQRVVKTLLKLPFETEGQDHRRLSHEIMAASRVVSTGA